MKTSNKILLGIISVIGLSMLSILIFGRSSLINYEDNTITGDGKIVKINHQIAEVSFFRLSGKYEVYIKKGAPNLVVETDENIHSFLNPTDNDHTTYNHGGNKIIKREFRIGKLSDVNLEPSNGIKVYLTTPSLERINIGGFTKLVFEDMLSSERFEAYINDYAEADINISAGSLKIDSEENSKLRVEGEMGDTEIQTQDFSEVKLSSLKAQKLEVNSSENSNIKVSGEAITVNIEAKDFAKIMLNELSAKSATIKAKDNTDISISVSDKLDVQAADFASVKYKGAPEITKNISAQASLNALEQ